MASLKEIAAELGVSPSTVSRALRNDPSISEAMRARVAESAERRGYRPDRGISSAMRRVRSGEARIEDGEDLLVALDQHRPGDTVDVKVRRNDEARTLKVTLR